MQSQRQIMSVYSKSRAKIRGREIKKKSETVKWLEKLILARHSWAQTSSVHHFRRARTPAAPYIWAFWQLATLSSPTRGVFHHLSQQVPQPGQERGDAAMYIQMSFWTPGFNRWISETINGKNHDFVGSAWPWFSWSCLNPWQREDSLSPFVVFICTQTLDIIHQNVKCLREIT